jgi:hypothetical protein
MNYSEKEKLYDFFLEKWVIQFEKVPFILRYLSSYPLILDKIDNLKLIKGDELPNSQMEWVSLVYQLDNPIENMFFREFWVPIQIDGYDFFIDLSAKNLSVFEVNFFSSEPYSWYKNFLIHDLKDFFLEIAQSDFDISIFIDQFKNEKYNLITALYLQREKLGFMGKIEPDKIEKEDFFIEGCRSDIAVFDNSLYITNISSIIIGLFPFDSKIKLVSFSQPIKDKRLFEKKITIKAFIFLLQNTGIQKVDSYKMFFESGYSNYAEFDNNTFKFFSKEKLQLLEIIKSYNMYKNSVSKDGNLF